MKHALSALAVIILAAGSHAPAELIPHERDHKADSGRSLTPAAGRVDDPPYDLPHKLGLARLYRKLDYTKKAENTYREILTQHPNCAEAHNGLGFLYENDGDYARAIKCYERALEARPGWARPTFHIGSCLLGQKRYKEAENMLRTAAEVDPSDASPRNCLGILYARTNKPRAAEQEYRAATAIRPDWVAPYWNLVLLYDAQGRYRESGECLDAIMQIDPDNFDALYQRVKHLVGATDYSMAERTARKLVRLYPRRAGAHEALGMAQWSRRELRSAEASFARALALKTDSAGAHLGMGHVRLWQKRYDEAEKNYRKALEIDPGLADAQHALEALAQKHQQETRVGGGCSMAPGFARTSPLALLQYLAVVLPALMLRNRL